jgi:LacI family transcriptional regulator
LKGFDPYSVLEMRIRTGVYAPGTWLVTEREMAEEFGIHRNVVRRAVARLGEAGLVERRAGHRPVVCSPKGVAASPKTIALVMGNEPQFHAFQPVLRGCEREVMAEGYRLVYMDTFALTVESTQRREREALESILQAPVAGVVIWAQEDEATAPHARRLMEAGIPLVAIDRPIPDCPSDFVGVDNIHAAAKAVEHLLASGRKNVIHITLSGGESTLRDRAAGYRQALRQRGISSDRHRVLRLKEGYRNEAALAEILGELLESHCMPDAIFAVNDIVAWRLIHVIRAMGLDVPGDVAVVGFDDIEAPTLHAPFLTTIHQPFEDIGRHAATALLRRIRAPRTALRHILLETSLIVRGSSQAVASATADARRQPASR